jgi:hypothetical protein
MDLTISLMFPPLYPCGYSPQYIGSWVGTEACLHAAENNFVLVSETELQSSTPQSSHYTD